MTNQIRIEQIRERGERVSLRLTGFEKSLIVDQVTLHEHRLVEGIVVTPSQVEILQQAAERIGCDDTANRMLTLRSHSIGELKAKLARKGFPEEVIAKVITKYRELGFLDDLEYARERVEAMLRKNPAGRSHLIGHLRKKMVSRSIAEQVVNTVLANEDETALAVKSLSKRWSLFRDLELERARTKAYNYLSRRGISFGAAKAAFERLYQDELKLKD